MNNQKIIAPLVQKIGLAYYVIVLMDILIMDIKNVENAWMYANPVSNQLHVALALQVPIERDFYVIALQDFLNKILHAKNVNQNAILVIILIDVKVA